MTHIGQTSSHGNLATTIESREPLSSAGIWQADYARGGTPHGFAVDDCRDVGPIEPIYVGMEETSRHELPPAGWFPNPEDPATLRYWDGATWTDHTMSKPVATPPAIATPDESDSDDLLSFFPEDEVSPGEPVPTMPEQPLAADGPPGLVDEKVTPAATVGILGLEESYSALDIDGQAKGPGGNSGISPRSDHVRSEYAPWWRRAVGSIADAFVLVAGELIVLLLHAPYGLLAIELVWFAYVVWAIGSPIGGTIGMRLMSLRCGNDDFYLSTVGYGRSFWRQICIALIQFAPAISFGLFGPGPVVIVSLLLAFLPLLDVLWPLWDLKNQTLHDKMAKTVVLYEPEG